MPLCCSSQGPRARAAMPHICTPSNQLRGATSDRVGSCWAYNSGRNTEAFRAAELLNRSKLVVVAEGATQATWACIWCSLVETERPAWWGGPFAMRERDVRRVGVPDRGGAAGHHRPVP